MTPFDLVKYEIDKPTGYLRVDRPQRGSSLSPTLYGFIPRTYCGDATAGRNDRATAGDGDPLDICVICERPVSRAEVIVNARVIGGIRTLDGGLADDKIVSVLEDDPVWGGARGLADVPAPLVDRLCHYFATYKVLPGQDNPVELEGTCDREEALAVVRAAMDDYGRRFGGGCNGRKH
ncbi:MAG: inorganic diphosphatase [Planctomycetota bacterium]